MKISLKSLLFLFSYILICIGLLILAENQSTEQPIGLLFVAMVTTPSSYRYVAAYQLIAFNLRD